MCPACLTTLALIAAGTTSTGGVTALVAKRLHAPERRKDHLPQPRSKEVSS